LGVIAPTAAPAPAALRRWVPLAALVVLSRVLVLLAAWLAENVVMRNPNLTSGDGAPFLRSLTSWDGWWYLSITRTGYHAEPLVGAYHDYAFLPAFPGLVRVLSLPVPGWEGLVAVVLANVLFVVGLVLLVRLTEPLFGWATASRSAALMALFPFSAAFSMAYSESLFLVLMLAAFLAAERRRIGWTGVLLALATVTRLQGVVLLLPLAWLLWERSGRQRPTLRWGALLLGPLVAAALYGWVAWLAADPAAYGVAAGAWGRTGLGNATGGTLGSALSGVFAAIHATNLVVLLGAVFLFVFVRTDRIPPPYVAVPALFLALAFLSGSLESIGRYVALAFPDYWILAKRRRWFGRVAWPVISGVLLVVVTTAMFAGWFVP
jgi:hypothetical protein